MNLVPFSPTPTVDCVQVPLGDILRARSFLIASAGYLSVLMLLFWHLFTGDVLHSGAIDRLYPPFIDADYFKALPYSNLGIRDFAWQFGPFEDYQYRAALNHRFPTWNPQIYLGQPFHADGQSAMLFPTHWIYFLIDPNIMRGPMAILRLWLSAAALFCLLRKLSLAPSAAFAGGSTWMLSAFNVHFLMWPHSNASLWMPLALLALDYLLLQPSWRSYTISSLVTAPLFLSGHPGTQFLCVNLIGLYVVIRLLGMLRCGRTVRQALTAFATVAAAGITAVLLALPALLPLWLQIRHSFDYLDPAGHRNVMGPIPVSTLWMFLIPECFGRSRGEYGGFDYVGPDNYIEASFWFGAIGFILAMAVLFRPIVRRMLKSSRIPATTGWFVPAFGISTFVITLLIVFKVWPVYSLALALPMTELTNLRRCLLGTNFAGAILAAWAVQRVVIDKDRLTAFLAGLLCVAACILVVSTTVARADAFRQSWADSVAGIPPSVGDQRPQILRGMFEQFAGVRMVAGMVVLLLGGMLLIWIVRQALRGRESPPSLRYALVAIITLDVMLPAYDFNPIAPLNLAVPPTPMVVEQMVRAAGDGRLAMTEALLPPNLSMRYGFRDLRGYDLPHDLRLVRLYQRLKIDGLDSRGLLSTALVFPLIQPEILAYLDRTCVRQLLLYEPNALPPPTALKLGITPSSEFLPWPRVNATTDGLLVFSNPNSYPRAYLANLATAVPDQTAAMDALLDDVVDLRKRSVYETGPGTPTPESVPDLLPATASITDDAPEEVTVDCNSNSTRLLVLSDRMDAGWKVQIDDAPATALTANYLFRGVFVPAGHHIVKWTYHAPGLANGILASVVTLAGLLIGLILSAISKSRARITSSLLCARLFCILRRNRARLGRWLDAPSTF
jgi:hypothetical protein